MSRFAELPDGRRLEFPNETSDEVIQATVRRELGFTAPAVAPVPTNGAELTEQPPDLRPGGTRGAIGEAVLSIGTSAVAQPVSGLTGIAGLIGGLVPGGESPSEKAARFQAATQKALTFEPITEAGAAAVEKVGRGAEFLTEQVRKPVAGLVGLQQLPLVGVESAAETIRRTTEEGIGPTAGAALERAGAPPIISTIAEVAPTAVATIVGARVSVLGKPNSFQLKGAPRQATERIAQQFKKQTELPTVEELFKKGSAAFRRADEAGVRIKPESSKPFGEGLAARLADEGIDPVLHPKSTQALKRIVEDTEGGLSFKQVETLRRIAKDAASTVERSDRRFGRIIIDEIDDYIARLDGSQATGNVNLAQRSITAARGFWARARKGELLEGLVDRAGIRAGQFSGSGFENALRTEFRQLALNEKRMRGFTQAERAAIERVAAGGPIANALRFVGKFAPRGVISTAITAGGGAAIGGPLGAIVLTSAAEAARFAATKATRGAATRAAEIARAGPEVTGGG